MTFAPKKGRWAAVAVTGAVMASLAFGASFASATTTADGSEAPPAAAASAATTYTISGKLLNVPADAANLALTVENEGASTSFGAIAADRSYVTEALPPGDYVLTARYMTTVNGEVILWTGTAAVTISDAPVTGVEISFVGVGAVSGHVDGPVETVVQMNLYSWSGEAWVRAVSESGWGDYTLGHGGHGFYEVPATTSIVSFTDPSVAAPTPVVLEPGVVEPSTGAYPYCTMYFSDAYSYLDASVVTVEPGATTTGINQTLTLKKDGCKTDQITIEAQPVTLEGDAVVGQTLTAVTGTWEPAPVELSYQWFVDGVPTAAAAAKATAPVDLPSNSLTKDASVDAPLAADAVPTATSGSTFAVLPEYVGAKIAVIVTGSRPDATSVTRAAEVGPVVEAPAQDITLDLPATVVAGEVAEFTTSGWAPGETLTLTLTDADGTVIETATFTADENGVFHGTFSPAVGADGSYTIRVEGESGSIEGAITVQPATTTPTNPPTTPPVEPTNPPVEPTTPPVEPTAPPVEPTPAPVDPTTPPGNGGGTAPGELAATGAEVPLGIGIVGIAMLVAGGIGLRRRSA